ncbi:sigma-70 family RNA polymerase sigma factor [Streptomyces sp. NPDC059894]|uniref:sigma-70 family RNA polymerase sigma factor n=1 Tax=unclassified Streptomyces TaxID=2593676 RepID=UPI00364E6A86
MRPRNNVGKPPGTAVVAQARAGDREALETLVSGYLPLVYNVVGRAMDGHRDVDDVVRETMLRAVNNLSALQDASRFRSWLMAIAVRQVRTWWQSSRTRPQLGLPDESVRQAGPRADFADLTVLRLKLSGQRLQAVEATRWLESEDRETLSLWWMEAAGELSRPELAEACGLLPHHANVRVRRVKERLEAARGILRALAAAPRCPDLTALLATWDGRPSPSWRERLQLHVHDCPRCGPAASGIVPAERLLGGFALVPLPVGLVAHVLSALGPASATAAGGGGALRGSFAKNTGDAARRGIRALSHGPVAVATATAVALTALVGWYAFGRTGAPAPAPAAAAPPVSPSAPPPAGATASRTVPTPSPGTSTTTTTTTTTSTSTTRAGASASAPAKDPAVSDPGCGSRLAGTRADRPMPGATANGIGNTAGYTDLGNGTVRDDVTCLIWQRIPAPGTYTYAAAADYCAGLDLAGGDWHLPSRIELTSVIDTTRSAPAIDTGAFPGTPSEFFWTSSAWAVPRAPARAWIVNFHEGLTSNGAFRSQDHHVRCVQSTTGDGRPAYQVTADAVTDPATGLTWQRGASPAPVTAAGATAYCRGLRLGGHSWRLPSVKELATTVDESRVAPAVDPAAFPDTARDAWYWTASTAAPEPARRWGLNYEGGYTDYRNLSTGYARCVH